MSLSNLEFELPRRVVLLSSVTTMPNGLPLNVTGHPDDIDGALALDVSTGEYLLDNSPPMTMYLDTLNDAVYRRTMVNTWELLTGGDLDLHKYFSYDPILERLVATKPITTTLNSFYLGNHHKISSGGQNVYTTNLTTGVHWYPMWGGVKDQHNPTNQDMTGVINPSGRVLAEYEPAVEPFGTFAAAGVPYINFALTYQFVGNQSIYGFDFIVGENLVDATLHLLAEDATVPTGEDAFIYENLTKHVTASSGDVLHIKLDHPLDALAGDTITLTLSREVIGNTTHDHENDLVKCRPSAVSSTYPWLSAQLRGFTDRDLAFKSFDDTGEEVPDPVVVGAVAKSAGASEYVLAEEGNAKTLHTDSDLLILTSAEGKAITWHRWSNETGDADWATAEETVSDSLHASDRSVLTNQDGIILAWHNLPELTFTSDDNANLMPSRSWEGKHKEIRVGAFTTKYPCHVKFEVLGYGDGVIYTEHIEHDGTGNTTINVSYLTLIGGTLHQNTQRYEPQSTHTVRIILTDTATGGTYIWQDAVIFPIYENVGIVEADDYTESGNLIVTVNDSIYDTTIRHTASPFTSLPIRLNVNDRYDIVGLAQSDHPTPINNPWEVAINYNDINSIRKITLNVRLPDGWIAPTAEADRLLTVYVDNANNSNDARYTGAGYYAAVQMPMNSGISGWKVEFYRVDGKWLGTIAELHTTII